MRFNKTFHEVFKEVHNAKTKKEKIAVLHYYSCPELKQVLGLTFNPNVQWMLPDSEPPYNPGPKSADLPTLHAELRRIDLFIRGMSERGASMKQAKREQVFIEILEGIDPRDAKLLAAMPSGNLPYKGLTRKLVAEAFPNLASGWFSKG
jgi:hypothetical protein